MKKDTLKTFAGLVIIGGIVVATFLYGNSQRQAQLKTDQDLKRQQASASPAKVAAAGTVSPTASPAATASPKGSASPSPKPTATPTTTPTTSPSASPDAAVAVIPDTGAGQSALLALASLSAVAMGLVVSRRRVNSALRSR